MSLTAAMNTAQSIFNNTSKQTTVVSTNISNAQNPNYVRRNAALTTSGNGAVVASIERAQSEPLLRQTILTGSMSSGQSTLLAGLKEIRDLLGNNDYDNSPSAKLQTLYNALSSYAGSPGEATLGASVVTAAQDLVDNLNVTSTEVQGVRQRADAQIKTKVDELNNLLAQFETANNEVVSANALGADPSTPLDKRETLLKKISEIVGVSTVLRTNGDMAIYTSEGTTLFERIPRAVSFVPTNTYTALVTGNQVFIDGTAITPGQGGDTNAAGSLQALLQIRDEAAPKFQSQLDEIARGLIASFAETGPGGLSTPVAGLFTNGVNSTIPPAGVVQPGLSWSIKVNALAKATPTTIRDGGMNGAAYVVNTSGSGYSTLIDSYAQAMKATRAFDNTTDVKGNLSLMTYASSSAGWLEAMRSTASAANETKTAMYSRASEAYSNETGVNLDEELSLLLDIEQSYKAATKLVSTIDEMMKALLAVAG
ncbi:flagellar hook-associated protein FlgK [Rhizobium helianthi]|uniref:Flagellar hook-associated protein 1 n=1 Tax=Rhizobium helianthi TaxID=1132695 RepID=A0ABW4M3N3_9HYPH